jgi:hypothetical protein
MPDPIRDIVVSGAEGGTAIVVLTELGMSVTLIEAGPCSDRVLH